MSRHEILKRVVDLFLEKKELHLSEITGEVGLGLTRNEQGYCKVSRAENLYAIERVFEVIDLLRKNELIMVIDHRVGRCVEKNGASTSQCELVPGLPMPGKRGDRYTNDFLIAGKRWKLFNYEMEMKLPLLTFRDNGYRTDEQKKSDRDFWLAIWTTIVASVSASFLTGLFSELFHKWLN